MDAKSSLSSTDSKKIESHLQLWTMQSRILTSCRGIRRRFGSTTATTSSSAGYFLPKTVSPAYGAAVDFLETQRQLIKKKLDEAQKDLASKGDVKCKDFYAILSGYTIAHSSVVEAPSSRVQELQIQLALTEPKTHKAYADGEGNGFGLTKDFNFFLTKALGDLSDPVYAKLHHNRWTNHVVPRLLKSSQELKIVGDMVPEAVQPTVNLELNFPNTKWWGAYGHAVPPNWALYSPSMTIITNDTTRRYFTLAMVDLGMLACFEG